MYAALFSMFFFVTLYLQQVLGDDALEAGLSFLPMTLSVFTASSLAPRLVARFGVRTVVTAGMLSATAGLLLLTGVTPGASYVTAVLPGGILAGLGMGLGARALDDRRDAGRTAGPERARLRAAEHLAAVRRRARAGGAEHDRDLGRPMRRAAAGSTALTNGFSARVRGRGGGVPGGGGGRGAPLRPRPRRARSRAAGWPRRPGSAEAEAERGRGAGRLSPPRGRQPRGRWAATNSTKARAAGESRRPRRHHSTTDMRSGGDSGRTRILGPGSSRNERGRIAMPTPRATSERTSAKSLDSSAIRGDTRASASARVDHVAGRGAALERDQRLPASASSGSGPSPASGWRGLIAAASSSLESSSRSRSRGRLDLEREGRRRGCRRRASRPSAARSPRAARSRSSGKRVGEARRGSPGCRARRRTACAPTVT